MGYRSFRRDVQAQIRSRIDENAKQAAFVFLGEVRQTVSGTRSGRRYKVPGTQREYTASAPGEAPARRTGDLARSFDAHRTSQGVWRVGNTRFYALFLEKGTSKMEPRPYFVRTLTEQMQRIRAILARG